MGQKQVWVSVLVGFTLLLGMSSVFAALGDKQCQGAIEKVQQLQRQNAIKKQEVDAVRVIAAIPSNFVSEELQGFIYLNSPQGFY